MKTLKFIFSIVLICYTSFVFAGYSISSSIGVSNCSSSITASADGNTGPYTFQWSNGATSSTISNVCSGTYTVTITNRYGCTTQLSKTIPIIADNDLDDWLTTGGNLGTLTPIILTGGVRGGKSTTFGLFTGGRLSEPIVEPYPNPFDDFVSLKFPVEINGEIILKLTDVSGKVLRNYVVAIESAGSEFTLYDLSQFSSGIYLLEVYHPDVGIQTYKLVK